MVYVVQRVSEGRVWPEPDLMTEAHFQPLETGEGVYYAPNAAQLLCGVVSRMEPQEMRIAVGSDMVDMGAAFHVLDATATESSGAEVRVRFLPLTTENFGVFKDHMIGWDEIAARFTTTEALRANFREMLVP